MKKRTESIDFLGIRNLFGTGSLRHRDPADVLGALLGRIYGESDCTQLKVFLNTGSSPYTEAGSEEYKKQCDTKLQQWLRSELINAAPKSPGLKNTTFYPAARHLITRSTNYSGAGGDILHWALIGKVNDPELNKTAETVKRLLDILYDKPNIYSSITLILNGSDVSAPESHFAFYDFAYPPFWCNYFAKIRRDVNILLRLQVPDSLQMIRFLIAILNFHLGQYVLRKCIAGSEVCEGCTVSSDPKECRPIILISLCDATRDRSQELYRRHIQIIRSRLAENVRLNVQDLAEKQNANTIEDVLDTLAREGCFSERLQKSDRFRKKMDEAKLRTKLSPVEQVSDAISRFYGRDRRQLDLVAQLYSTQGGGAGLVAPKRSSNKRYIMESDLLEALAYICITQHGKKRLSVSEVLDWWYSEYGFVIGRPLVNRQVEMDSLRMALGREVDQNILRKNYKAFEEFLVRAKLLEKFSDASAMVVCGYETEETENAI